MFERMEIAETIYEGFVEPSYKKTNISDNNCASKMRQNRGEAASSKIYPEMGKYAGNHNKRYVNLPLDRSQLTFLINVPGHSSDKCKVLNDSGTKYSKGRPFKERRQDPTANKILEIIRR